MSRKRPNASFLDIKQRDKQIIIDDSDKNGLKKREMWFVRATIEQQQDVFVDNTNIRSVFAWSAVSNCTGI